MGEPTTPSREGDVVATVTCPVCRGTAELVNAGDERHTLTRDLWERVDQLTQQSGPIEQAPIAAMRYALNGARLNNRPPRKFVVDAVVLALAWLDEENEEATR